MTPEKGFAYLEPVFTTKTDLDKLTKMAPNGSGNIAINFYPVFIKGMAKQLVVRWHGEPNATYIEIVIAIIKLKRTNPKLYTTITNYPNNSGKHDPSLKDVLFVEKFFREHTTSGLFAVAYSLFVTNGRCLFDKDVTLMYRDENGELAFNSSLWQKDHVIALAKQGFAIFGTMLLISSNCNQAKDSENYLKFYRSCNNVLLSDADFIKITSQGFWFAQNYDIAKKAINIALKNIFNDVVKDNSLNFFEELAAEIRLLKNTNEIQTAPTAFQGQAMESNIIGQLCSIHMIPMPYAEGLCPIEPDPDVMAYSKKMNCIKKEVLSYFTINMTQYLQRMWAVFYVLRQYAPHFLEHDLTLPLSDKQKKEMLDVLTEHISNNKKTKRRQAELCCSIIAYGIGDIEWGDDLRISDKEVYIPPEAAKVFHTLKAREHTAALVKMYKKLNPIFGKNIPVNNQQVIDVLNGILNEYAHGAGYSEGAISTAKTTMFAFLEELGYRPGIWKYCLRTYTNKTVCPVDMPEELLRFRDFATTQPKLRYTDEIAAGTCKTFRCKIPHQDKFVDWGYKFIQSHLHKTNCNEVVNAVVCCGVFMGYSEAEISRLNNQKNATTRAEYGSLLFWDDFCQTLPKTQRKNIRPASQLQKTCGYKLNSQNSFNKFIDACRDNRKTGELGEAFLERCANYLGFRYSRPISKNAKSTKKSA